MGKLKISKNKKSRSSKGSSGIPNWLLSTIILIVALAVIGACVVSAVLSSGVIGRSSLAMGIDDIKVNRNMMAYYFRTNYVNQLNQLSSYASYFGGSSSDPYAAMGLDVNKSLKDQIYAPFGMSSGTASWYDTILNSTKNQVTEYLIYAAAAKEAGIALTDEDRKTIETNLDNVIYNIMMSTGAYSYSYDACCELAFGDGVTADDVRDALELQMLATKMSNYLGDKITSDIKADEDRINKTYNEKTHLFNYVDYYSFSFDVHYDDVVAEKYGDDKKVEDLTDDEKKSVLELYEKKIKQARERAEELSGKATLIEFKAMISEFTANEEYAGIYDKQVKDLKSEDLPSENDLATIKNTLIQKVLDEIEAGEPEAIVDVKTVKPAEGSENKDTTYSVYDITISQKFSDAIKAVKNNLFATIVSILDAANCENVYYYESKEGAADDKISVWAFDKARVTGEKKIFETGDGANNAKVEVKSESFSAQIVVLTKTSYKDLTRSRDFAYLHFTKEESAKAALTELEKIEGLDKDKFLALAESESNPADAYQFIEDCAIGTMGSEEFDEWLFSVDTKVGSYTKEAIKMSDGSYMVAFYVKQNTTPEWKYQVTQYLVSADYTEAEDEIINKFKPQIAASPSVMGNMKDSVYPY